MPSPSSHSPLLLLVALSLTAAVQARADPEATVIVLAKLPSKQEADAWVQSRKAAVADANKALVLGRFGPFPLVVTAADKAFPGKAIDGAWVIGGACEGGAEKPAVEVLRKHFKEIQLVSGRYEGALDCPIVRGTMVVMLSNGNGAWAALVRDTTGLKATDGEPGTGGSSALDVATAADAQARKLRKRDWVRTPVAVHLKQPGSIGSSRWSTTCRTTGSCGLSPTPSTAVRAIRSARSRC